jgi:hypothetical protein
MKTQQEYLEELEESLLSTPDHELWHKDSQGMWHRIERMTVGGSVYYFYEQSQDREIILGSLENPSLESNDLVGLFRQVCDQHTVDLYAVPIEQWTFSSDVKEG